MTTSALNERPNAEALPASSGAAILQNGHYLPPPTDHDGKVWVRTTALVQRSAEDLYALWRNLESTPAWQEQITKVVSTGPRTSRWTMKAGTSDDAKELTWNAEILADEPGKRIAWHSVDGDINEAGEVIFEAAPGGRGTTVIVLMEFRIGKLAAVLGTFVGRNPKQAVIENLRHFKALAETGEIPTTQYATHGDRGVIGKMKRSLYGETVPTPRGTISA